MIQSLNLTLTTVYYTLDPMRKLLRTLPIPEALQRAFELGVDFRTKERIASGGRVYPAGTVMSSRDLFDNPLDGRYGWIIIEHTDDTSSCRIVLNIRDAWEDFLDGGIRGVKACKDEDIYQEAEKAQRLMDKFFPVNF